MRGAKSSRNCGRLRRLETHCILRLNRGQMMMPFVLVLLLRLFDRLFLIPRDSEQVIGTTFKSTDSIAREIFITVM